jgi:hypothetical protein
LLTGLQVKIPANREINREFCRSPPVTAFFLCVQKASKFKGLRPNSLGNRTGNSRMCCRENFSANRVLYLQVFDPVRSCGVDNNTSDIPATDGPPCGLSCFTLCCKTRLRRWISWRGCWVAFASLFLPRRLHWASSHCRRGMAEEFDKTPQVLCGRGQQHFVFCIAGEAGRA